MSIFKTDKNPNVWAACDEYFDQSKITNLCDTSRSAAPSISSSPTSSSVPSINPSASSRPSISLVPSTSPSVSLIPTIDPIRPISGTPFYIDSVFKKWEECKIYAETYHFVFASIQNQQENDAVYHYMKVNGIKKVWLGGYQTSYEDEPAGNWAWLDGTRWNDSTYTNWYHTQPDNVNNNEHYLILKGGDGLWFDNNKGNKFPCLFREPTPSFAQKNAPTSEPTTSSKIAPTTASLNIETLTSTVLTFFESIVTFFKKLLLF